MQLCYHHGPFVPKFVQLMSLFQQISDLLSCRIIACLRFKDLKLRPALASLSLFKQQPGIDDLKGPLMNVLRFLKNDDGLLNF